MAVRLRAAGFSGDDVQLFKPAPGAPEGHPLRYAGLLAPEGRAPGNRFSRRRSNDVA
jgi:hypothetical protein